jgi:Co/Zn/Cd efflux system component
VFAVEVIGAVLFNSLRVLADAGHVLTDVAGIRSRCSRSGSRAAPPA